jgi:hypothetical protein
MTEDLADIPPVERASGFLACTGRSMSAPTACWQPFPFLDHRTQAEIEADHVEAAVNSASTIGWHQRQATITDHRSPSPRATDAPTQRIKHPCVGGNSLRRA